MEFQKILQDLVNQFHEEKDLDKKVLIAKKHITILKDNVHLIGHPIGDKIPEYEVWRNVKDYEGVYQISNWGNIKALERFFIKNRVGGKSKQAVYQAEKIRTKRYSKFGYLRTSLWNKGKPTHYNMHRLVAELFIPNPGKMPQVLHKDDNPKNAKWNNLEWGTQSKNIQDAANRGRGFIGSKNGNSKLKDEDIPKIRKMLAEGKTQKYISDYFGVSQCPIGSIKANKTWNHLK